MLALVALIFISYGGFAAIRPVPEYLKSAVVYQIVLRNFTRDGNFAQATRMLDHIRSLGVDVVYLSPFVEMDRDMDMSGWSQRQVKSGFNSPKNPYRISDYDKIDPDYGGDADFDGTWSIWDEEFLQFYCDRMNELPEPFVTSVFTASSHSPFVIPERYRDRFPVTNPPLYGCIRYSDNALRLFFEKARRQPWLYARHEHCLTGASPE